MRRFLGGRGGFSLPLRGYGAFAERLLLVGEQRRLVRFGGIFHLS